MRMSNEIDIAATPERIFERARATDRWPEILPHYRFVRVLQLEPRLVEMAAWRPLRGLRGGIPVRWRALQWDDGAVPEIVFRHVRGWTKGMHVRWRFTALSGGITRVSIEHELGSPLAPFIAKYFIDPIASQTLACMKSITEAS
jgi:ribosome-associated toxin RatA of RatAB toxin-antitoxin module